MRQDFIGQELTIGDFVTVVTPHYKKLALARITGFKPKLVMLDIMAHRHHTWRTNLHPDKLVKVPAEYGLARMMAKD